MQAIRTPAGKSPSITELYKQFEEADAAYKAIPDTDEKRWQRAMDRASKIGHRIIAAPASDINEMLLKIRLTAWFGGYKRYAKLEDLDRWRPGFGHREIEHETLAALRDDLQRLAA
jgi:hypothetical protein